MHAQFMIEEVALVVMIEEVVPVISRCRTGS